MECENSPDRTRHPYLHLSLLAQVLDLGLSKDDVGVRSGVLVHIRLVDHEENVLRLPDGHPGHSGNLLETQLAHDLPGLLLPPALLALVITSSDFTVGHSDVTLGLVTCAKSKY